MQVIATKMGFYGGFRRRKDEVFEFHGKKPASWMEPLANGSADDLADAGNSEPLKDEIKKPSTEEVKEPKTLSEMAKKDAKDAKLKGAEGLV